MTVSVSAESLNPTLGPSDVPDGATQPSQTVIDQDQEDKATISQVEDQQLAICPDQDQQATIDQDQDQHTAAICQDQEEISEYPKTLADTEVISSHELKPESTEEHLTDKKGTEGEDLLL